MPSILSAPGRFIGCLGRLLAKFDRFSPRRNQFGPPLDPPSRSTNLSAKSADYPSNSTDFRPVAADSVRRLTHCRAWPIYWLPRPITGRTWSIFAPSSLIWFGARIEFTPDRFTGYLGRLSADSDRLLQCRQRFALSRTAFGSSLNRTGWRTTNPLFDRVGDTEYHIHE
jgi:hypothetical protein